MGWLSRFKGAGTGGTNQRVLVLSSGLEVHGQRELALAVRPRRGERRDALKQSLVQFFESVRGFAEQGQLVHAGDLSEFAGPGFLNSNMAGIAWVDAHGVDSEVPDASLVGVPLDPAELAVAKACSVARVVARLGEATRQFPFPLICDRDRKSVAHPADDQSLLAGVAVIPAQDVSLLLEGERLTMGCGPSAADTLARAFGQLPENAGFALVTARERTADAHLVWTPGQSGPSAITPPGSRGQRITGSMLIVAADNEDDVLNLWEDGFALLLRADTWVDLRAALVERRPYELRCSGSGKWLRVEQRSGD